MKLWQTLAVAASTLVLYEAFKQRNNSPQEVIVHYADDMDDWDDGFEDDWWSPQLAKKQFDKKTQEPSERAESIREDIDSWLHQIRVDNALDVLNDESATADDKERARKVLEGEDE